jgi:putative SOS response-associated peptidase YedK
MCANYIPVTSAERLLQFFGVIRDVDEPARDVFPAGLAPFIRLAPDGTDSGELIRTVADGIFRFVPDFVAKVDWARHTYNARAETVDTKTTYKKAWASGHRYIIPTEAIYEPNYESGQSVRWRIRKGNGEPMGIAGTYRSYLGPDSREMFAFSMVTVNADDHPFMRQFHAPGEEKRMVVILEPEDFEGWLTCPVAEAKLRYCKQWHGELVGEPVPLPKRPKKSAMPPAISASLVDLMAGDDEAHSGTQETETELPEPKTKKAKPKSPKEPPKEAGFGTTGDLF